MKEYLHLIVVAIVLITTAPILVRLFLEQVKSRNKKADDCRALIDHIFISSEEYYSFAKDGLLKRITKNE